VAEIAADQVVVLFTGSECEEHPGRPCMMEALGPYDRAKADRVMERYLADAPWTAPHRLTLRADGTLPVT